jgi:hypothetical protein
MKVHSLWKKINNDSDYVERITAEREEVDLVHPVTQKFSNEVEVTQI